MKTARRKTSLRPTTAARKAPAGLRQRLAEAEEALRAIRSGEVDAVMVTGRQGPQVFTLQGAEQAYRLLIESMNEGAVTLTADKMILYANECFARMVQCPLEQVMGSSLRRFLSTEDRATLRSLLKRAHPAGAKFQVNLKAGDGSQMPVHISISPLAKQGAKQATFGMVVTDMTEARRNEELLRDLTHRLVQVQEAERGRVALELHDNITQLLCGILVRCQTLANTLSPLNGSAKAEATQLRDLLGQTAEEVERISRNLRPSVLDQLGLVAVMHETCTEFRQRTGVALKLSCVELAARLPADTEVTLYRTLQEALKNIEKHAGAGQVTVGLRLQGDFIQLVVKDDGTGFDPAPPRVKRNGTGGVGLLSMRERATYAGGDLKVKSGRGGGTEIEVRIPVGRG